MLMNDTMTRDALDGVMTPRTCKAARILLKVEQIDLAQQAGINVQTLRNYENEVSEPAHKTWLKIKRALEQAGVRFIDEDSSDGPGVRLRKR
jgi:DNA-binding XRE family transcriptional regulator